MHNYLLFEPYNFFPLHAVRSEYVFKIGIIHDSVVFPKEEIMYPAIFKISDISEHKQ